jgi:hypothetical protein
MTEHMRLGDIAFVNVQGENPTDLREWSRATNAWVVKADQLAVAIAPLLEHNDIGLVVITDPNDMTRIQGLLSPRHVREQVITHFRREDTLSFAEAIRVLEDNPRVIEGFGHEYLNQLRPEFYYCAKGGHMLESKPPCPKHG